MICDHYKLALRELAAAGAEPNQELHAHLQACASCRSAFENERSLFASIDSALRSSANAEIPPGFIPTVRTRVLQEVQGESPVRGRWTVTDRLLWVPALVAATIVLVIFVRLDRSVKLPSTNDQFVAHRAPSPVAPPITPPKPSQFAKSQITLAIETTPPAKAVITHEITSAHIENREPEIIVPPDQEILLARYAAQWGRHHRSSTLLTETDPDQTAPLQVPLIQIAELDVKPLADTQADDQDHGQE
jgi:hypothetical protein